MLNKEIFINELLMKQFLDKFGIEYNKEIMLYDSTDNKWNISDSWILWIEDGFEFSSKIIKEISIFEDLIIYLTIDEDDQSKYYLIVNKNNRNINL